MLEKAAETTDDSECQERPKSAKNKEVTSNQSDGLTASKKPAEVPTDDSTNTIKETCSDKLNNKLSNKPDADLAEVVQAWPELPSAIRSAIVAIVRTSREQNG